MMYRIFPGFYVFLACFGWWVNGYAAGDVPDYLATYRQTQASDYREETSILAAHDMKSLIRQLEVFYSDTLPAIRQKAYSLTYRKGLEATAPTQLAVSRLAQALGDSDHGTVGLVIDYLKSFAPGHFRADAKAAIGACLQDIRHVHFDELALLAGYVGCGEEVLLQHYATPGLPIKEKWPVALALARMGQEQPLAYCLDKAQTVPEGNMLVEDLVPFMLYTRQKPAVDFCIKWLYGEHEKCRSANPEWGGMINCAYPILEKVAAVIADFPVKVDASGMLQSDDYPAQLRLARDWLSAHPDYTVVGDGY